jgi:hypothetical protein
MKSLYRLFAIAAVLAVAPIVSYSQTFPSSAGKQMSSGRNFTYLQTYSLVVLFQQKSPNVIFFPLKWHFRQ